MPTEKQVIYSPNPIPISLKVREVEVDFSRAEGIDRWKGMESGFPGTEMDFSFLLEEKNDTCEQRIILRISESG